jgi:mannobiose 2-epimerase
MLLPSLSRLSQAAKSGLHRFRGHAAHPENEEALRIQLTQSLWDVVNAWFPRCLDVEYGGFLCDFTRNWVAEGPQQKKLEFQARQTRAAAQAALFDSSYVQAHNAARHGFEYLKEVMWDEIHGGWFYMLHQNGEPEYKEKHLHGVAYAIQACVACHDLTASSDSIELAKAGFDWIESNAHDRVNGGYFPYLMQNGTPITAPKYDDSPLDLLGKPIGGKDTNTTLDLTEAFADLFRITKDKQVGRRLEELLLISSKSMFQSPGILFDNYTPDWRPIDGLVETGVNLQSSCALVKSAKLIPANQRNEVMGIARSIVQACVDDLWDPDMGGFFFQGIVKDGSQTVAEPKKEWWVQAEGIRALMIMASEFPEETEEYFERFLQLWNFICANLIDYKHNGWRQFASSRRGAKSHMWKDASHEIRALIECLQLLERSDLSNVKWAN